MELRFSSLPHHHNDTINQQNNCGEQSHLIPTAHLNKSRVRFSQRTKNKTAGAYSGCETGGISEVGELEVFSVLGTMLEEASFTSPEGALTASGWLVSLISVVCKNIPGKYTFFNT